MRRVSRLAGVLALAALTLGAVSMPGERDVFGRPVPEHPGRPTIVLYANRSTGEPVGTSLAALSARLDSIQPIVLVRVDLRGIPWFFRGFADHDIRARFVTGLRRFGEECRRLGVVPSPGSDQRLFFIPDAAGQSHAAVGLQPGFRQAIAIAYAPDGRELARVPFPEQAAVLEASIRGWTVSN